MRVTSSKFLYPILSLLILWGCVCNSSAQSISPELKRKLTDLYNSEQGKLKEKAKIRISVQALPSGSPVYEMGQDDFIHIASIQKLFLSYAVLNILGAEYRFTTEFYTDYLLEERGAKFDPTGGVVKPVKVPDDNLGNLYIRGYGNPSFLHQDIYQIARELMARGVDGVKDIVIDDTLFIDPPSPDGDSPYKAGLSANSLEFNSYRVSVKGGASGEKPLVSLSPGVVTTVENRAKTFSKKGTSLEIIQNPDNSILAGKSFSQKAIDLNFFRINIEGKIGAGDELFERYMAHPYPSIYFGSSFKEILQSMGIRVMGSVRLDQVPASGKLLYNHESKPMAAILSDLNHYSSNFIVGQLLYAIGQDEKGRFNRELGLTNMEAELRKIKDFPQGGKFLDGSGLDKENRVTLRQLMVLLQKVHSDPLLSYPFFSSLSRFGVSGTLKNRNILKNVAPVWTSVYEEDKRRSESIWGKTGTVDGVSGVAGIAPSLGEMLYAYSIVIDGMIPKAEAILIEDSFISIISGVGK